MNNEKKGRTRLAWLKVYILMLLGLWTILVTIVLIWNVVRQQSDMRDAALVQAKSAFQKDVVYRLWASTHGGVYVPATEETPPNKYLSHVEERDITTPSGRQLTLMNPAYMTRTRLTPGREGRLRRSRKAPMR